MGTYRGTRAKLREILRRLPAVIVGRVPDPTGEVDALLLLAGTRALGLVKESFVVKARGGTDEAGITWPPLQPETVAYSRRHPGATRKGAARGRPLLSAAQDKLWRQTYARCFHKFQNAGQADAAAHAAGVAWLVVKAAGGQTKLMKFGGEKVEILRDKGILLNSLSPGSGSPDQVLQVAPGGISVGTNVPYAKWHHWGTKHSPQRRLWADPKKWPARWYREILKSLLNGVGRLVTRTLGP